MKGNGSSGYVFAIVGATGVVGKEMCRLLSDRKFPAKEIRLFASERSVGQTADIGGEKIALNALSPDSFTGVDFAFFTAGAAISKEFVPLAVKSGALVIDNTSAFRVEKDVPLAVPEVNPHVLAQLPTGRIISVPNCSTIQMVMALGPIHEQALIKRVVVSTYQSTSGAGRKAMEELSLQVKDLFNYRESKKEVFPDRIAFNLIPRIGDFLKTGETGEEEKIRQETHKILEDEAIGVSATCVRVPTFHGHALSVNVETKKTVTPESAKEILSNAKGVKVVDDPKGRRYPILTDAVGNDSIYVGRIRADASRKNCLNFWVVGDNVRKGAALNGLQIAEHLIAKHLI